MRKMNGDEAHFKRWADTRGLELEPQVEVCMNGRRYFVDFAYTTRDGRKVFIELDDSHRGSDFRDQELQDYCGNPVVHVDGSDRDTDGTVLRLKARLERR